MKKLLALALAITLSCSLALPATASAESADARLARVTELVKQQVDVGDGYASFSGVLEENPLAPLWRLEWGGGGERTLRVEAAEDGTVFSLHRQEPIFGPSRYDPAFQPVDSTQAAKQAEAFLARVLRPGVEQARLDDTGMDVGADTYRLGGTILLNGLPSPLRFSLSVRGADGVVTSFRRDNPDRSFLGGIPAPQTKIDRAAALSLLRDTLSLRLEYVPGTQAGTAVLRYLPDPTDDFYVDGTSGALVNLSDLYRALNEEGNYFGGRESAPAAAPAPDRVTGGGLTPAEQAGVEKLEGVLDKQALDDKVRAIEGLGLKGYALSNLSYQVDGESGAVSAQLHYTRSADKALWSRAVTVDAKSGALLAVSGWGPFQEDREAKLTEVQAQQKAEAFLKTLWGVQFALTERYDSRADLPSARYSFTFAQKANGFFFPTNSMTVGIDALDGSVCQLFRSFEDGVTFQSTEGLISADAALDAWLATFPAALGYLSVPAALDPSAPEAAPLLELGHSYFYNLKTGFALGDNGALLGIDAKSGQPVSPDWTQQDSYSYDDLVGHWAQREIEALAAYGAGYPGGSFLPGEALTQADFLCLLLGTQGYGYDPATDADALYSAAYRSGFLTPAQRRDGEVLTRAAAVKLLLDGAGYGEAARLSGIYTCTFSDGADIPAEYLGYAAIAQALGVVSGDGNGAFCALRPATRVEGAMLLYQFMAR